MISRILGLAVNTSRRLVYQSRMELSKIRMFDIAANLADASFKGEYYDKKWHDNDVDEVIKRA